MRGDLFFIGTIAFALGVLLQTLYSIPWYFIALAMFCGCICVCIWFFERQTVFLALAVLFFALSSGIVRTAFAPASLPAIFQPILNHEVTLTGTIVADPDIREKNQQLVLEVDQNNIKTNVLLFAPLHENFVYGEGVTAKGTLTAPAPFTTDTGRIFRYDHYLSKKDIFSIVTPATVSEIRPPNGMFTTFVDVLFAIKHSFVAGLARALPDPYGELATGLLTGDQHSLGDALITALALSGLIWVVVLSGYHVTIIAEGVVGLFSFLPKRFALLLAGFVVAALVIATGASAPSLRGSVMAGFALFAQGTGRKYDSIRALCATLVIVLLWNPLLLAYDQGFQLSIVVTPALIFAVPIIEMRLLWIKWKILREVIVVSTVAQLAVLPLLLWQTGQLSIWAIPANILVMWLVPLVMLLSVIAGFAGILAAPLAPLLATPAHVLLFYILTIAKISASLPLAGTIIPAFPFIFVIAAYSILAVFCYWLARDPAGNIIDKSNL